MIYFEEDENVAEIGKSFPFNKTPYKVHKNRSIEGVSFLIDGQKEYRLSIFGDHNLQNLNAALKICESLSVSKKFFTIIYKHLNELIKDWN